MGWNSWNAFGSGNTEALTKCMADKIVELGLRELGYKYVVLDDGCYKPERVNGHLSNDEIKFPSGFKSLADYLHDRKLLFGMYNDIGTNLCAGAAVGTCGHETEDAGSYLSWGVDFLKVDNCYYLWDNATFSDPTNAKYVFAPNIRSIQLEKSGCEHDGRITLKAVTDGCITGNRAGIVKDYVTGIGTWDGTGPDHTPTGINSSELIFRICAKEDGEYKLYIEYATGQEEGIGSFVQIAVGEYGHSEMVYDDFLPVTETGEDFALSHAICISLKQGENRIRIMNHRRQENTLGSYGTLVEAINKIDPGKDMILSICEWGKTNPHDWGYKVGDSWRILNDITFQVGADNDPGNGAWNSDYTTSVLSQYNKAVIMDEYAGPDRGWNDPDMMMIGMNGLDMVMCKTHMTMWCMMNSPLMLGLDLRRVNRGDDIWNIIANKALIDINQDALGIQAKRIFCSAADKQPDIEYVREEDRVDVLAKPLSDGSFALSFINLSRTKQSGRIEISIEHILKMIGIKMQNKEALGSASSLFLNDLWSGAKTEIDSGMITVESIDPCDNVTFRIYPK